MHSIFSRFSFLNLMSCGPRYAHFRRHPQWFRSAKPAALALLSAIVALLTICPVEAARLPVRIYGTEQGLANDVVNKIYRDSRGFLWFCTEEGLSRFDGSRFKNYTLAHGLPHRNVNDFLETNDGRYLIATSGGLVLMDPFGKPVPWNLLAGAPESAGDARRLFTNHLVPEAAADSKVSKSVLSLTKDASGAVYAVAAPGAYRVDLNGQQVTFERIAIGGVPDSISGVNVVFGDSRGNLWIGKSDGVLLRSPEGAISKISDTGGNSVFEDSRGRIWVDSGGEKVGIRIFEITDGVPRLAKTLSVDDGLPVSGFSNAVAETPDGRIFVHSNGDLFLYRPDAAAGNSKFESLGVKTNVATADSSGNIWFNSIGQGAARYSSSSFFVFGPRDGLPEEPITSIRPTADGGVLVTQGRSKLAKYSGGRIESLVPFGLKLRDWIETFLDFESSVGDIWIPSENGLMRFAKPGRFQDLARTPPVKVFGQADGLSRIHVSAVFEDSRGDIWFGVADKEISLHRIEKSTGKVLRYTAANGLPTDSGAISFGEDSAGNVWIGFYFGQIVRYRNGHFDQITEGGSFARSFVSQFHTDRNGRFWIATASRGLFRVDEPDADQPVYSSISAAEGLSSNQALCLAEDAFGKIYVGTGSGVNRIDPETSRIKVFTQNDGLPGSRISKCAASADGRLWFASNSWLIAHTPQAETPSKPPPIFIESVVGGGRRRPVSELGEREMDGLEFSPDEGQLQIGFFAVSFGAGENLRYRYRLNDLPWSEPREQRSVDFGLEPGDYTFAVRAITADGVESESEARVSFTILRPVWRRPWFQALVVLVLFTAVVLIYRRRTSNLTRINAALSEAKLAEEKLSRAREERIVELQKVRTRIATDLHDDIGSSLSQIALHSELAKQREKETGNAGASLDLITNVANELVDTMSDIVWAINPKKDHLQDLTQRMRRFASNILTASDIDFEFVAPSSDVETPLGANIRREVFLIFKETVNNIAKHSGATEANIGVSIENGFFTVRFSDNGKGFDIASAGAGQSGDWSSMRGGNGLINMKRRAKDLGGRYLIESSVGNGTNAVLTVSVDTPVD